MTEFLKRLAAALVAWTTVSDAYKKTRPEPTDLSRYGSRRRDWTGVVVFGIACFTAWGMWASPTAKSLIDATRVAPVVDSIDDSHAASVNAGPGTVVTRAGDISGLTPVKPVASFISRDAGTAAGGTTVVITGSDFQPGITVSLNATSAVVDAVSAGGDSLWFTTPVYTVLTSPWDTLDVIPCNVSLCDTIPGGFWMVDALTTTHAEHDFEDNTMGSFGKVQGTGGGLITVGEWGEGFSISGTFSVLGQAIADVDKWVGVDITIAAPYPPYLSPGVFQRFYMRMDATTLAAIDVAGGQMKTQLNRTSGTVRWEMCGMGSDFGGNSLGVVCFDDSDGGWLEGLGGPPNGPTWTSNPVISYVADEWMEMQQYLWRDTLTNAVLACNWFNGKLGTCTTDNDMGSGNVSTQSFPWSFGGPVLEGDGTDSVKVYIDDPKMANGFIPPIGL